MMRLLHTYSDLSSSELARQILARKNIQATLVASNGRTINKWTVYETNFGDDLSGSLYVEDSVFDQSLQIIQKLERDIKFHNILKTYFAPVLLQSIMFLTNFGVARQVKELLASFSLPIKYTGAIVYFIWLIYETNKFIAKWNKRNSVYKIDNKAVRDYIIMVIMAGTLFLIAYLSQ